MAYPWIYKYPTYLKQVTFKINFETNKMSQ